MKNLEKRTLSILIERLLSMSISFSCNRVNVNCGYVIEVRFVNLFPGDLEKLISLVAEFPASVTYCLKSDNDCVSFMIYEDD